MASCPADCADITITNTPPQCEVKARYDNIARIGFYTCDTEIPDPITEIGLQAFVDSGKMAFSSSLANVVTNAPEWADVPITDCAPALRVVSSRVLDFQDRVAIDIAASTSPVAVANPFTENDFWYDKMQKQISLNLFFVMCSGAVYFPLDEKGNPLKATITAYATQENIGTATSPRYVWYIVGQATFNKDYLSLNNKPALDANGDIININDWGLF